MNDRTSISASDALALHMCLCFLGGARSRLGVREVILVDCDVVAASNVNRQVLYSTGDVGRRKVEAALDGLKQHNIRTSQCISHTYQQQCSSTVYAHTHVQR